MVPDTHIAIARAAALNMTRVGARFCGRNQKLITSVSRTTVIVPAAGPKRRTEAKTNVSETEMRTERLDIAIVNEPVRRLRASRMNHCESTGSVSSCWPARTKTATPIPMTTLTNVVPSHDFLGGAETAIKEAVTLSEYSSQMISVLMSILLRRFAA